MKIRLTWKIWLLIIVVFFSILSVVGFPPAFLQKGVLVTSVDPTSPAFDQGLREGQIIISVDGKKSMTFQISLHLFRTSLFQTNRLGQTLSPKTLK